MPDDLFGVFREERGHGVGDPYGKGKLQHPRHKGKQFVTSFPQKGQLPSAYIDKDFKRLSEGDLFVDPSKIERKLQRREGVNVSTKPFVPSNPTKKSPGSGSLEGCIGNVILSTEGEDETKIKSARDPAANKMKIYTAPAPKGSFGYSLHARTVGGNPPGYMADEYQRGRRLEKSLKKNARERISRPFVSTFKADGLFWSNPYTGNVPGPDRRPSSSRKAESAKTWKPSNPPRKGAPYCAISHVGRNYVPDPVPHPKYRARKEDGPPAFKPPAGPKQRLSVWAVNPYEKAERPPPNDDFVVI